MTSGTITQINPRSGMFAVRLDEEGSFAVFSCYHGIDIAVGDRVQGNLGVVGLEPLLHLVHGQVFDAFGESGECTLQQATRFINP